MTLQKAYQYLLDAAPIAVVDPSPITTQPQESRVSDTQSTQRKTLSAASRFTLQNHVKEHHNKGLTDREFAVAAQKALGFYVPISAVEQAREMFGYPRVKGGIKDLKMRLEVERARIAQMQLELERATQKPEAVHEQT